MGRKRNRKVSLAAAAGFDGKTAIGEDTVPDPFAPTRKITVTRNMVAPVDTLRKRRELNAAEVVACERFRDLYDSARIGGARAVDYTREPVDGGTLTQPLSVEVMRANAELAAICRVPGVGKEGFALLVRIVGEERGLMEVARQWGGGTDARRVVGYVRLRFLEAVRALVDHWAIAAVGRRSPLRASAETVTGPSTEWRVGRFGDLEPVR